MRLVLGAGGHPTRAVISPRVLVCAALVLPCLSACRAEPPAPPAIRALLDMGAGADRRLTPSSGQVTVSPAAAGVEVTIRPGAETYPGVRLTPAGTAWDLSRFGHVEARIVNTGAGPLSVALRVDNAGDGQDSPWDTESVSLAPGQSGTVRTLFGYSYGLKPGYPLKPGTVSGILLFVNKSDTVQSFRVESLLAAGPAGEKPPLDPASVRVAPPGGLLFGPGVKIDPAAQIVVQGAQGSLATAAGGAVLQAVFPSAPGEQTVSLRPTVGRWDLRNCLEVRLRVRNAGPTPVTPRARLDSNGGPSDWVSARAPLAPGASTEIVVPFANAAPADAARPETANHLTSDAVSAVSLGEAGGAGPPGVNSVLQVIRIRADLPPTPPTPAWLGKRPPVAGAWVKTLDDEFNGRAVNASVWNVTGENYYDKQTHWSKEDVIVGDGVVRLRYEKKTGFQNDDPKRARTDYAAGFLDTYGKWTQRYGYFEARVKLPRAPGLWPAFWMMPDRGGAADPQWKRQDTANGGMEFDVLEHLTRWGPYRYNIALHYDGYGKDHKSLGSDKIYAQPDRDGFFTCGLLWTPGSAVFYCNGREVLRWTNPRISDVPATLIFTLPMGGWDNSPLDDARLPDEFVVDYVRVWQRKDLAELVRPS